MRLASSTLFLFFAISNAAAQTPSFDCQQAHTLREHTVCGDSKLADLDARVAQKYTLLEAALSPPAAALVAADQSEWLQWLDKVCPPQGDRFHDTAGCLEERYNTQLSHLAFMPQTPGGAGGLVIYPRTHFVFVVGRTDPKEQTPGDPGYGYGEFTWPQIDRPTTTQQAWNAAVLAATIARSGMWEKKPATLDEAVDASGYVYGFYTLVSVNTHFIDVQLGSSTYGWGAAHPNTSLTSFAWWMEKGRALIPEDVFASNSGWKETMAPLTLAKLREEPGADALWRPGDSVGGKDQLHDAIVDGLAHPVAWTLSSDGFTVTFGSYAVGPYSSGMPTARFSWQELQPMLAAGFDPASLPAALGEMK